MPDWTLVIDGEARGVVTLPARLDGRIPDDEATYTLRTRVVLPPTWRRHPVSLSVPQLYGVTELRAAGEPIPSADPDLERGYRSVGQHIFTIPDRLTDTDALSLELVVHHDWNPATWFDSTPRLTLGPGGDRYTRSVRAFNAWSSAAALGALHTIMFTYLVMFAMNRRRREYGWWGIRSALASVYLWFVLGQGLVALGQWETFFLTAGLVTAVIAAVYSTNAQFALGRVHKGWAVVLVSFVAAAAVFSRGFHGADIFGGITIATCAIVLVYETIRLTRLVRQRPRPVGALPNLVGWVLLAVFAAPDFLQWTGIVDPLGGLRPACAGLALFALFQFVSLCGAHVISLRQTDALNVELQRQIAERSRQLSEALARLDTRGKRATVLAPGELVDDRYRVVRKLGAGAMGEVFEVERTTDRQRFALKVLSGASDAAALARFAREAHLAAQVTSPHVVRVFDIDFASSGFMYIVMEKVDGATLKERAARFGNPAWAVPVLRQIAEGLAAIHACGVIHRDLKPANVLTVGDGDAPRIKITDFGISGLLPPPLPASVPEDETTDTVVAVPPPDPAGETTATIGTHALAPPREESPRRRRPSEGHLTRTGALLGTPTYMAPELGSGMQAASQASDVFSLGVLAFELLCGKRPFSVPPCYAVASGRPPPAAATLGSASPALPEKLLDAVQRALDSDPARRPTAAELAHVFG
jgi:serine/threonine-protein kinase